MIRSPLNNYKLPIFAALIFQNEVTPKFSIYRRRFYKTYF